MTRVDPRRDAGLVPYGLYRAHGFVNSNLAAATGFDSDDLALFWQALQQMWEIDRSAARGLMACRALYVFTHESQYGNAPADQLFSLVTERVHKTPANREAEAIARHCLQNGLIFQVRGSHGRLNVLRFVPPIVTTMTLRSSATAPAYRGRLHECAAGAHCRRIASARPAGRFAQIDQKSIRLRARPSARHPPSVQFTLEGSANSSSDAGSIGPLAHIVSFQPVITISSRLHARQ